MLRYKSKIFQKICTLLGFLGIFVFYVGFSLAVSVWVSTWTIFYVTASLIADVGMIVLAGLLWRRFKKRGWFLRPDYYKGFSWFGIVLTVVVLFVFYLVSQFFGAWLNLKYPAETVYSELSNFNLYLYLFLSVTFAPICEELVFRGFGYLMLRRRFGVLVSAMVSSILFCFIHGTIGHIPVTIGLSFFLCLLCEMSHSLKPAILAHMLYNFYGIAYTMQATFSIIPVIVIFLILALCFLIGCYEPRAMAKLFGTKWFDIWTKSLEEKRKHWADSDKR